MTKKHFDIFTSDICILFEISNIEQNCLIIKTFVRVTIMISFNWFIFQVFYLIIGTLDGGEAPADFDCRLSVFNLNFFLGNLKQMV